MNEPMKKILAGIAAIVLIVVCAIWFLNSDLEHIEDANGPEDYSLAVITDQQLLDHDMGSMGFTKTTNNLNGTVRFHSDKFTGVMELMWTNVLFTTGFTLDLIDYEVNAGNFRMVVINEGEIIADLKPEDSFPVDLGELKGDVSVVIAGESADFSFGMFKHEYESYGHAD